LVSASDTSDQSFHFPGRFYDASESIKLPFLVDELANPENVICVELKTKKPWLFDFNGKSLTSFEN